MHTFIHSCIHTYEFCTGAVVCKGGWRGKGGKRERERGIEPIFILLWLYSTLRYSTQYINAAEVEADLSMLDRERQINR